MFATDLAVGGSAWRAGRAASCLGALLCDRTSPDEAFAGLAELGSPEGGWWEVIASLRKPSTFAVALVLPRPGDVRGVALPRDVACDAAVGWSSPGISTWLVPMDCGRWLPVTHLADASPPDVASADRHLREAVVSAAHALDDLDLLTPAAVTGNRASEVLIDAWLTPDPQPPAQGRDLAARGLRMLRAVAAFPDGVERDRVLALDSAARGAVEAAYGSERKGD